MKTISCISLVLSIFSLAVLAEERIWTRNDGKSVRAELVNAKVFSVILELPNSSNFEIDISDLSLDDQVYVADWWMARKNATKPPERKISLPTKKIQTHPSFPIPDPNRLPKLPETECRIVLLRIPGVPQEKESAGIREMAKDDLSDLVKLGDRMVSGNLVAIRKGGTPVIWFANGKREYGRRSARAVMAFNERFVAPLVWITESGRVGCNTSDRDLEAQMSSVRVRPELNVV